MPKLQQRLFQLGAKAMTPEIVKALVDVIGVWSVILIAANAVSKIVVWHFTEGTKP